MEQKNQKMIFIFHIISFELEVASSHNLKQDICQQQSMC